jgi:uncharacterized protein (DUF362 family)
MPVTVDDPESVRPFARPTTARVAVVRTRPQTVLADYARVMDLAGYRDTLRRDGDTLIKLNLSWTKYFPSCSSQPWQVDGVVSKMLGDGYERNRLIPIENKTVVTSPREGCRNNRWEPVLQRHGLTFMPLTEVDWQVYRFKSPLLKLNDIFPDGIQIPAIYPGRQILHLPTVKTHGHAVMTGSVKNSFGGLLKEVRHYAHKYMHEVLVDLLYMQRELHPAVFTVMDGTVAGRRCRTAYDDSANQELDTRRNRFAGNRFNRGAADGLRPDVDSVHPYGARTGSRHWRSSTDRTRR